jgi:predicted O-methyltransferase YrrM
MVEIMYGIPRTRPIHESLEIIAEPPYLLQLFPLLKQVAGARTFFRKHRDSFVDLSKLLTLATPMDFLTIERLISEYDTILSNIHQEHVKLVRRKLFGLTLDEGFALYLLIRAFRPKTILETGVANGLSSRIILEAIKANNHGALVSTEIQKDVGVLVPDSLRKQWRLHVGRPSSILVETLEELGQVDFFLHDSDHSYNNMLFEFRKTYPKMSCHGLMVSDDVETNAAFMEFAESIRKRQWFVYGFRKILGVIRL